jgi:hypothetical protein
MAQDNDMLTAVQNSNRLLAQIAQYMSTVFPQQSTTASTVGAAGGASALPATPLGYMNVTLPGGAAVKVPYYNP